MWGSGALLSELGTAGGPRLGRHPPPSRHACPLSNPWDHRGHFLVPEVGFPLRAPPHWTHGQPYGRLEKRVQADVSAEKLGRGRRRDESAVGVKTARAPGWTKFVGRWGNLLLGKHLFLSFSSTEEY